MDPPSAAAANRGDWRALANRARAVADHWRSMHAEEAAAHASTRAARDALRGELRLARDDREAAQEVQETALRRAHAARQEEARWKARSEAQRSAKVVVELEEARRELRARDDAIACGGRALASAQHEAARERRRLAAERVEATATADEQLASALKHLEVHRAQAEQLGAHCATLEQELMTLRAANPPGALDDLRVRVAHAEAVAADATELVANARKEASSWKTKARQLIASQRLAELQKAGVGEGVNGARGVWPPAAPAAARATDADGGAAKAELAQLKAEVAHWRALAAHEIARQRAFQEALWADDRFTQTTKQRIGALLRESGSAPAPAKRGDGPTSWRGPASPT